jgi:predicted nucleic acid-binding protein
LEQPTLRHGLIDTDILIDASRGLAQAGEFLNEMLNGNGITISVISAMELIAGCRDSAQLSNTKQFLASLTVHPITEAVSARARSLMETFTLSHGLLSPDALVAGTALESGIALYTRNIRHFRMIPELLIIKPY